MLTELPQKSLSALRLMSMENRFQVNCHSCLAFGQVRILWPGDPELEEIDGGAFAQFLRDTQQGKDLEVEIKQVGASLRSATLTVPAVPPATCYTRSRTGFDFLWASSPDPHHSLPWLSTLYLGQLCPPLSTTVHREQRNCTLARNKENTGDAIPISLSWLECSHKENVGTLK